MEQCKKPATSGTFISLLAAFAVLIVLSLIFKTTMMPKDEKYKRSCMQGVATAALDAKAAYDEDVASGPSPKPSLYASFPWINPESKPENKFMGKAWDFCDNVLLEEQHNNLLKNSMAATAVGSHSISAANLVLEHIAKGWGRGADIEEQKKTVAAAVADWGTHGHDQPVQDVLALYDEALNEADTAKVTSRILNEGTFDVKDICAHETTLVKSKLVKDPAAFMKKIGCGKN